MSKRTVTRAIQGLAIGSATAWLALGCSGGSGHHGSVSAIGSGSSNTGATVAWTRLPSGPAGAQRLTIAADTSATMYAYSIAPAGAMSASTDGGQSWSQRPLGQPLDGILSVNQRVPTELFLVRPGTPQFPDTGLSYSNDAGLSWTGENSQASGSLARTLAGLGNPFVQPAPSGYPYVLNNVVADPNVPGKLFACATIASAWVQTKTNTNMPDYYVLVTTDGGKTWTAKGVTSGSASQRLLVALPTNPTTLLVTDMNPFFTVIDRSVDGGATWTSPSSYSTQVFRTAAVACCAGQPATVYATGVLASGDPLLKVSHDGGATWGTCAMTGFPRLDPTTVAVSPTDPNVMYVGTRFSGSYSTSGVYKSTDGGQHFTLNSLGFDGTVTHDVRALAVSPLDGNVLLCTTSTGSGFQMYVSRSAAEPSGGPSAPQSGQNNGGSGLHLNSYVVTYTQRGAPTNTPYMLTVTGTVNAPGFSGADGSAVSRQFGANPGSPFTLPYTDGAPFAPGSYTFTLRDAQGNVLNTGSFNLAFAPSSAFPAPTQNTTVVVTQ